MTKEQLMKRDIRIALRDDQVTQLKILLEECKGTYAVKYVLEVLMEKENQHTLWSAVQLLNAGLNEKQNH